MKDGRVLGESGSRPGVKMGAHTEGVEAQRLLALAGNGNHDRGPFDLVRLATGQPPVGVKQHLELRAGIDLMPAAPVLRHRLQEEGLAERARAGLLDDPASAVAGGLAALKTRKTAVPVAPAPSKRPPARACGSWPPSRLARKIRRPSHLPPGPCGRERSAPPDSSP